jgi:hypothetical protein
MSQDTCEGCPGIRHRILRHVEPGLTCGNADRRPQLAVSPYPQTVVAGSAAGRICCENCRIDIS